MNVFNLLTPITYWLLIIMWAYILYFYGKRLRSEWYQGSLMILLFAILTIDAFRTLFESIYFGAWYTSLAGLLPKGVHDFLVRPEFVIIPKLLNVIAAALIIIIMIRKWVPKEVNEIEHLEEIVSLRTQELSETVGKLEQEITERKQVEAALHSSQEELEKRVKERTSELQYQQAFLEAVLDNIEDGIVACDEKGMLTLFNRATLEFHGIDQKKIQPEEWAKHYDLYHADGKTLMRTEDIPLYRAFSGERFHDAEMVIAPKKGKKRILLASGQPMRDAEDKKFGAVVSMHNITEQKLSEEALHIAKEQAEEANRSKSIFLTNMSHELRTPLNAILGFSQLMSRDASSTAEQQKNLSIINRSGEHLLVMINNILDLSKIEAGKVELESDAFDLPEMLSDIGEMVCSQAQSKGLRCLLELDPGLKRYVRTDVGKLRQVLINILDNAVKYTEEGGVALRARTIKVDDIFHLTIDVEDTGPGIPEDKLEVIFEPFVQVGSVKAGQKGTGLGLSITRSFVQLMGGTLSVESELGKGSVFRVELPIEITEANEIISTEAPHLQMLGLAPEQPQYRILIVEDDEENLLLLETLLTQMGFNVQAARNGKEAFEIFQQWHADFIWMDIRMPVMDGYEATQKIRGLPDGKEVKILALTASAFKEEHEKILAAGCNDVVHKPYKDYEIFDAMARYLDVHYIYKEGVTRLVPEMAAVRPTAEALARLPTELLESLQKTARSLDMSEFNKLLDDVAILDPELRDGLAALVSEFRFDEVLKLCKLANDKG